MSTEASTQDANTDLPECVREFFASRLVQHLIRDDEREAILALAKCGVFCGRTKDDVSETWAAILIDAGRE